jgi:hypothetical protein
MTKLEEKLLKLGYKDHRKTHPSFNDFYKFYDDYMLVIYLNENVIIDYEIAIFRTKFKNQQDIDNLQQAFDTLQNDLKELKEYE